MTIDFTAPYPDDVCKGIAKREDLKPGVILWHILGSHANIPTRVKILSVPVSYRIKRLLDGLPETFPDHMIPMGEWVFVRQWGSPSWGEDAFVDAWESLSDCGIGARYNMNRLCLSYDAAVKYAKAAQECIHDETYSKVTK